MSKGPIEAISSGIKKNEALKKLLDRSQQNGQDSQASFVAFNPQKNSVFGFGPASNSETQNC